MDNNDISTMKLDPTDLDVRLDDIYIALNKLNRHFEKEDFKGERDPRTINATDIPGELDLMSESPFEPWIAASFFNRGPNIVYTDINRRAHWGSLQIGESEDMDFSGSEIRIRYINYICDPGGTALLEVRGKY